MTTTYQKGKKVSISEHFKSTDFDCKCTRESCLDTIIDDDLIESLEDFWALSQAFYIDSGFRCMEHNEEVKGAPNSQHLLGKAADCRSKLSYNGNLMARMAEDVDRFKKGGIGIYPNFVHVDVRQGPARWSLPIQC